jgi:hypothetical protein
MGMNFPKEQSNHNGKVRHLPIGLHHNFGRVPQVVHQRTPNPGSEVLLSIYVGFCSTEVGWEGAQV